MTKEELLKYCEANSIEIKNGKVKISAIEAALEDDETAEAEPNPDGSQTYKEGLDEKENDELVKLAAAQHKLLKKVKTALQNVMAASEEYSKWLTKESVQAILSTASQQLQDNIQADLDKVKGII